MLMLKIQVPADRAGLATAKLTLNGRYLWADYAAASATPSIAAAHDNPLCDPLLPWGHAQPGIYYLAGHARSPGVPVAEYGRDVFLFQDPTPRTWSATRYRAGELLAYGGAPGADKLMRRTQGGIRLSNDMIRKIASALAKDKRGLKLEVRTVARRLWWTFWLVKRDTRPLSLTEPPLLHAPHDELSLTRHLMAQFNRAPIPPKGQADSWRDDRDSSSSSSSRSSGSSSGSSETYAGQGGTSGGAGASGSWAGAGGNAAAGVAAGAGMALAAGAVYTAYAMSESSSGGGDSGSGGWGDSSADSGSSSSDSGGSGGDGGGGGGGD